MKKSYQWCGLGLLAGTMLWAAPVQAAEAESHPPEAIVSGMSVKLVRGLTNVVTCPVELPKQCYKVIRDRGWIGCVAGPLAGVGMILYRVGFGAVEAVTFLIPDPGFYDPLCVPAYPWQGWGRQVESKP